MALKRSHYPNQAWQSPHWPETLPEAQSLRLVYGAEADELTIRFPDTPNRDIIVVFLATPDVEYSALMVHEFTGEVVGVQVDYLANYASSLHPSWQAAMERAPSPDVAARIVRDIRKMFTHCPINPEDFF